MLKATPLSGVGAAVSSRLDKEIGFEAEHASVSLRERFILAD
jgi:hypothetical protein